MRLKDTVQRTFQNSYIKALWLRKFINTFLPDLEPNYLFARDKRSVTHASTIWAEEGTHFVASFEEIESAGALRFAAILKETIPNDTRVLDMCCNQGRFLRFLSDAGHKQGLYGFDIMKPAVDYFYDTHSAEMPGIEIQTSDAGDYFRKTADGAFDYLITYSAALELIHPKNDIFAHMNRICTKGAVLAINENGHAYPRFWRTAFKRAGFVIERAEKVDVFTLFVLRKV